MDAVLLSVFTVFVVVVNKVIPLLFSFAQDKFDVLFPELKVMLAVLIFDADELPDELLPEFVADELFDDVLDEPELPADTSLPADTFTLPITPSDVAVIARVS